MSRPPGRRLLAALVLVVGFLGPLLACRAYEPLRPEDWGTIAPGDDLLVTTEAGESFELEVVAVDEGSFRGGEHEVDFGELSFVERREFRVAQSWFFVGALVLLGAAAVSSLDYDFDFGY